MKVEFEIVKPDEGSCFRFLHQKMRIKNFVWAYHYHPEIEIVSVASGSGTRHVGNHLSSYDNGELVLIGANLPHSGFGLNATDPHEEIVMQVNEDMLSHNLKTIPEMKNIESLLEKSKYGICFGEKTKKELNQKIYSLVDSSAFQKYIGLLEVLEVMASTKDYTLLNKQIVDSAAIHKHKARLQKIFTYVEQHYKEDIDIKKVTELVQLSLPSFCNYFKKTTLVNFTDFVNHYRIQKSSLLLQQDKTISEAAFECGFNNVTYFNKVFKNIMNETPSEFKRKNSL